MPDFLRSIWSSKLPPHIQTILAKDNLDAASQLADRLTEIAPLHTTASIAQAPETVSLLQKIEDMCRQVTTLFSGHTAPETNARLMTSLPRPTAPYTAVTVGTTGDSGTKSADVHHCAPSTSRKTAATGIDGGRFRFHKFRPPVHH